jgi:transaldolase
MNLRLEALHRAGVSVWLDDLSRDRLVSGGLARLVREDGVSGVTTNPSIFAKAIAESSDYDDELDRLTGSGTEVGHAVRRLTASDVRDACDVLRPVSDATARVDGRVSIEVDPRSAHDADAMRAEAHDLWRMIDRPNLFIKIPGTRAGLPAISALLAAGISVNVTLIFSLARYGEVQEAFLAGMEEAAAVGRPLEDISSVASFFVSRVDAEVDARLDRIGTAEAGALRGRAAIANARLAYRMHERLLASPRWRALSAAGALPQRPLWASTSVKDPAYPDTRYVDELVAPGVVNTMPEATLRAVADHGKVPVDSIRGHYADADAVLEGLRAVGVDYDDVVATLERRGLAAFEEAWAGLYELLGSRMADPARTRAARAS